jgi:type II secretory ATPase GspE/PulE/Tfp pilus assembly ATPase PilB-like protein
LRKLRDIFPAVDRTTRALSRVVEGERNAWKNTEIPFKSNTAPVIMMDEARGDYCDLQRILTEMRPHLGDRTLADFDGAPEEAEKQESRPTTHLLDRIFRDAATRHVRDVYIEAGESSATLKYRVGREIQPIVEFPRTLYRLLLTRLKHLASLDITERRRRQEGLICFSDTSGYKGLNVQVQTIPDQFAERVRLHLQLPSPRGAHV